MSHPAGASVLSVAVLAASCGRLAFLLAVLRSGSRLGMFSKGDGREGEAEVEMGVMFREGED